ncbi:MAG: membrane integrity-associated transporter subunit PqiC [Opitutaceae bacterium]|jgi:uncharacterized lipoprotein YmbA|nr:membrane integrity-associated transporter subunit PqiC [Opitutaceae bacterium]
MNPLSSHPALPARGSAAGRALRSSILWSVVGSLLLAACSLPTPQADPVRYFTLSGPVAGAADGATVRPVQLAGHLRGRQMAVRTAANEVVYLEEVRWAEPLDEAITQVLRARAGAGAAAAGSTVAVQIQRCELNRAESNSVQVAATYAITAKDGAVKRGTFSSGPRTWDGRDAGTLVGQIRDAINELGDAIAAALDGK